VVPRPPISGLPLEISIPLNNFASVRSKHYLQITELARIIRDIGKGCIGKVRTRQAQQSTNGANPSERGLTNKKGKKIELF